MKKLTPKDWEFIHRLVVLKLQEHRKKMVDSVIRHNVTPVQHAELEYLKQLELKTFSHIPPQAG